MILLQSFRFFGFLLYAFMAGYILYKNPKSMLNITCALLISSFAIWTVADTDLISKNITKETVILLNNISSIGWISISAFFACFALVLSKKEKLLKKKWVLVLIFILPVILLYKQWTVGLNSSPVPGEFGWYTGWKETFWTRLYYVYYISYMLISIYIIYRHGKQTNRMSEKKQSIIVVTTVMITLIGITITDVILPALDIHAVPQLGKVILLVFSGGIIYAIVKYEFLTVSLAFAAENIISTMEELFILTDHEGSILDVNKAVIDLLKYEQKELSGKSVSILFSGSGLTIPLMERITQGEKLKNQEAYLFMKDANVIPVIFSCSLLKDKEGDIRGMVFIASDISVRKQAEEALRKSERQLSTIYDTVGDAIYHIEVEAENCYRFVSVNKAFFNMTGSNEKMVLGKMVAEVIPEPSLSVVLEKYRKAIKENEIIRWEDSSDYPTGRLIGDVSVAAVFDDQGRCSNLVGTVHDITIRKQAEEELRLKNEELQKLNTEKDKFFSIIAHDLRGPFSGFLGLTKIMAEELPNLKMAEIREMAVNMEKSATNLFRLLENLLEWSTVQQGLIPFNPGVVQLHSTIIECTGILMESIKNKRIEITYDIPVDTMVFADSHMLQTVIRNLVSNAVKFTPKGGKVTLSAKVTGNNNIEISIQDSGIGMSTEIIDHLFQLNVKTNRPGTEGEPSSGLGLLLCKEFIEKLGGKIWIESEEGIGSIFHFTLPHPSEPEEKIVTTTIDFGDRKENQMNWEIPPLKILIAEDDENSQMLISLAVKAFSKEILKVRNGFEVVEACHNNPDIDLVLMDIQMPQMDGYEATRQIRQFNKEVIIIAQTAYANKGDREKAIEAGCNEYITKPIKKAELVGMVKKYFVESEERKGSDILNKKKVAKFNEVYNYEK